MSQQQEERGDKEIRGQMRSIDSSISTNNTAKGESTQSVLESEITEDRSFSERWKTNRFFLIRGAYYVIVSIWVVFMAVGGFIAWLIAMLFI